MSGGGAWTPSRARGRAQLAVGHCRLGSPVLLAEEGSGATVPHRTGEQSGPEGSSCWLGVTPVPPGIPRGFPVKEDKSRVDGKSICFISGDRNEV